MKHWLSHKSTPKHRLYSLYYVLFAYVRAFLIIILCLWAGNLLSYILPIMIPGSILGLLILFFLMSFQIIPTKWVKCGCQLFMRYMMILFVPAAMGIMDNYYLLLFSFMPIILGSLGSTLIVLLLVGYLTQYLHTRPRKEPKQEVQ
ncbi:CidA/LrgA family protein [Zophobihabitans entericus]|uniref:CidA/LrgA family protein n=1 Tax=Zophobihabitans entericus TaxID=1635327 RepID=A0A6G9ID15_9GAMM|nr:CidA/LrgA family protein [Zophobihabitans entericus]QIQ22113.1 CidA/LrgA family protein [Zophobihabitans entericus]